MTGPGVLDDGARSAVEVRLAATDRLLARAYPGPSPARQPVHTAYVPADAFTADLAADWGRRALDAAAAAGGVAALTRAIGVDVAADLVETKLTAEPIEDLRLDFEDGYGHRPDAEEDADAVRAAQEVNRAVAAGTAPPFIGIRFKCLEAPTRARGLRTLDLFIGALVESGGLPDGLVLTLPKVSTVAQVEAMVYVCERLEAAHRLTPRRLRFEVQMETPQLILGADGTVPCAQVIHAGAGRVSSLHYGTYDYSASLGIAAAYQSMEHPAADYAKSVMQVAVAGTGVHLSDGSTNILPVGDPEHALEAWKLHARLVRRHLERGIYQGWDLHPAQLPTRFLATYAFYRDGFAAAAARLRNYVHRIESSIMDEPATAKALADFIHRGLACGALTEAEVESAVEIDVDQLRTLALGRPTQPAKESHV
ncbi:MAG TPA: aldolase [Arthrobacter sp.]|nr:aldolase [Arthrobacter sp.]